MTFRTNVHDKQRHVKLDKIQYPHTVRGKLSQKNYSNLPLCLAMMSLTMLSANLAMLQNTLPFLLSQMERRIRGKIGSPQAGEDLEPRSIPPTDARWSLTTTKTQVKYLCWQGHALAFDPLSNNGSTRLSTKKLKLQWSLTPPDCIVKWPAGTPLKSNRIAKASREGLICRLDPLKAIKGDIFHLNQLVTVPQSQKLACRNDIEPLTLSRIHDFESSRRAT